MKWPPRKSFGKPDLSGLSESLQHMREGFTDNLDELKNRALDRSVRLAVTGLSQSGKTVFITSLIHQLLDGTKLPFFGVASEGRFLGAKLVHQTDGELPEFRYRDFIEALTTATPVWPNPTDRISSIRLTFRYRPTSLLRRKLSDVGTMNLDIIDYPGEWLLDLPLLNLSYEDWSRQTLDLCQQEPRATLAKEWLDFLGELDPQNPAQEGALRRAAELYTTFLRRCKDPEVGLSLLQPGHFTMPGDLEGAPILVFCPLQPLESPPAGSLYEVMAQRFDAYKEKVVKRFYREQFSSFDRQILLIDLFKTLNRGHGAFRDMQNALGVVMESFAYGRSGLFGRLFHPRIDRVLFAATKADHVATNQHHNLRLLLEQMVADAAKEVRFSDVRTETMTLSSVKCTETVVTDHQGHKLSCVKGIPQDRDKEVLLFPGEIPAHLPTPDDWVQGRFNFKSFRPPRLDNPLSGALPHIRLDQALEFLIGDKLT
jgi:predicted YcjX-like family ATPase